MNTYTIGQQVEHKSFGHGTIISIEGMFMIVNFNETGVKRVLASSFVQGEYAPVVSTEVEAASAPTKSIVTASDIWHMGQGIWSYEFTNAMAEIAAKSTGAASDISATFKKSHKITIAQAEVLARVAAQNNITI